MILHLYSCWIGSTIYYCAAHDKAEAKALFVECCGFDEDAKLHRIYKEPMHKQAQPRFLGSRTTEDFGI